MRPRHSYASWDLKKYSYVTCRGEQCPSKFDTYAHQVKSMFGCEADLNTLTARQLKSTFGTRRLIIELYGQQVKGRLPVFPQKCQSIVH